MTWLFNLLTGGFIQSLLGPILGFLNKKTDAEMTKFVTAVGAEKEYQVAVIRANAEAFQVQRTEAALRWGWWGTRWLLLAAAVPPIIHSGAVYLDSTFKFGWAIARAPGVYEGQELTIIAAVVGYQVTQTAVGGFMAWLNKK